jgi:hypothetical protein
MADYYGMTRSNYFAVKDEEKFLKAVEDIPISIYTGNFEGRTLYGFTDSESYDNGNIYEKYDNETDEYIDVSWEDIFTEHLEDGWVAIIMHIGNEKYRYFSGSATAYNNKGEVTAIYLSDIMEKSKELGKYITSAEY